MFVTSVRSPIHQMTEKFILALPPCKQVCHVTEITVQYAICKSGCLSVCLSARQSVRLVRSKADWYVWYVWYELEAAEGGLFESIIMYVNMYIFFFFLGGVVSRRVIIIYKYCLSVFPTQIGKKETKEKKVEKEKKAEKSEKKRLLTNTYIYQNDCIKLYFF